MQEWGVTINKQRVQRDVKGRDHKIDNAGLRVGHLQHLLVKKGSACKAPLEKFPKPHCSASMPMHTVWGINVMELQTCVQLKGYDRVGITEMWWNGSHDWTNAME